MHNPGLSFDNIGCDTETTLSSEYAEVINANDVRVITVNTIPNHDHELTRNQQIAEVDQTFRVVSKPTLANSITTIASAQTGRPQYKFGVAINGIPFDPAPAEPFIFANTLTGEYNWDWVFEPTNNSGSGANLVGLDCASAHQGPQGYHYHGNPFEFVEVFLQGVSTGEAVPTEPLHIGWAADGFPIVYLYGPDGQGGVEKLLPSYQLKSGERPGDGVSEPCGEYTGKYTVDYEYFSTVGDLDACNGIERSITIDGETFTYFYVVTEDFPQIGRCLSGLPHTSFQLGG